MTHQTNLTLCFEGGYLKGHISAAQEPRIEVRYLDQALEDVRLSQADDGWELTAPVPLAALSDGVHCFVVLDLDRAEKLGDVTLIAGEPAADDLRSEIGLLRAELDMLKQAFRRSQSQ